MIFQVAKQQYFNNNRKTIWDESTHISFVICLLHLLASEHVHFICFFRHNLQLQPNKNVIKLIRTNYVSSRNFFKQQD